jgi:hypothetical protein
MMGLECRTHLVFIGNKEVLRRLCWHEPISIALHAVVQLPQYVSCHALNWPNRHCKLQFFVVNFTLE